MKKEMGKFFFVIRPKTVKAGIIKSLGYSILLEFLSIIKQFFATNKFIKKFLKKKEKK